MPGWALVLIQQLAPVVLAELGTILENVKKNDGVATPEQAVGLKSLLAVHKGVMDAVAPHIAGL